MANCRSDQHLGHQILNLNNRKQILDFFLEVLSCDSDLSENEDYFSEDTLELGYDSEAERIVKERTNRRRFKTPESFKRVFEYVFTALSDQEFFGDCDIDVIDLGDGRVSVAYVFGGNNQY